MDDNHKRDLVSLQKSFESFVDETRKNFSSLNSDRESDNELMQTTNRKVAELQGQVENLLISVRNMTDAVKNNTHEVTETVEDAVDGLRKEIRPKKIIIQQIPHFSFVLWWKNKFGKTPK